MVSQTTLALLRCPQDRSPLRLAEPDLVARLNASIDADELLNQAGQRLGRRIDGGLVREAGDIVYPIVDEIPVLLADEAIPLDQLDSD